MLFWCRAIFDFPVRPLAQTCVGMFHRACVSVINCNKLLQSTNVEQIYSNLNAPLTSPHLMRWSAAHVETWAARRASHPLLFFSFFRGGYLGLFCLVHSIDRSLSLLPCSFLPHLSCVTPPPSSLRSLNLSFEVICEAPLCSPSGVPFLRSKCLKSFYKAGLCWNRLHVFCWHFDSLSQGKGEFLTFTHFIECYKASSGSFSSPACGENGERENLDVTLFSNAALPLSYRLLWSSEWRWHYFRTTSG